MLILALVLQVTTNCQTYGVNTYCNTQDNRLDLPQIEVPYKQLLQPLPMNRPRTAPPAQRQSQREACLATAKKAADEGDNETAGKVLRLCS